MDAGADRSKPRVDLSSLEVGGRYRVDWKHAELRRTFRSTGTLIAIEERPADGSDGEPQTWLAFEVKPRFGEPTVQRMDAATVTAIEPS